MSKRTRLLHKLKHVYLHNTKLVLDVENKDIELIIEGLEKQIAKKVIKQSTDEKTHYKCNCGYIFKTVYNDGTTQTHLNIGNYCHKCGQKLNWRDEDE